MLSLSEVRRDSSANVLIQVGEDLSKRYWCRHFIPFRRHFPSDWIRCRQKFFLPFVTNGSFLHLHIYRGIPADACPYTRERTEYDVNTIAFKEIFLPIRPSIRAVCHAFLRDDEEAEDATQEVYLRLWKARMRLDGLDNPRAYAIRIARNYCLNLIRKASNSPYPTSLEAAEVQEVSETHGGEADLLLSEQIGRLRQWLRGVSELHRTVFAMSHFRRLSNGEIAERLGLTEGNVRVILCRLRREAKEVMKDDA